MELNKNDTRMIKGLAALFLVFLHLFNTTEYSGRIQSILILNNTPIEFYISLVTGSCVPIYLFCSGYGLAIINKNKGLSINANIIRVLKLLINYWIILIIFIIVGYLLGNDKYPGNIKDFIMNFFLLSESYNGAWWFLQTYVILVLTSKVAIRIVNRNNSILVILISGILYFIAFLQSIRGIVDVGNNEFIQIIYNMILNLLNCQFSFIVGIVFIKESIISKIRLRFINVKFTQIIGYILILFTFIINIIIGNYVIDPITAILIITAFSIIKINKNIKYFLLYISNHSTNIWLTHMFFYIIFFSELVYAPKYSVFIFIWLIILCIGTSYLINLIYKPIINFFDKNIVKKELYKIA